MSTHMSTPLFISNPPNNDGQIKGVQFTSSELGELGDEMSMAGFCARIFHDDQPWPSLQQTVAR